MAERDGQDRRSVLLPEGGEHIPDPPAADGIRHGMSGVEDGRKSDAEWQLSEVPTLEALLNASTSLAPPQHFEPLQHETLKSLDQLCEQRRHHAAALGYQRLADSIEQSDAEHGILGEAIWLEAVRGEFETSMQTHQPGKAMSRLSQRFQRFDRPQWQSLRDEASRYYHEMISLSVDVGLDEQALEIFDGAREHVRLTVPLRRKLLEVSIRLGRTDPGTARLCIEEAFGADVDPADFDGLMNVIRRAIRIDLSAPSETLLDEFSDLNQQVRQRTDLRWPVAHLAMHANRKRNCLEQLRLARSVGEPAGSDADAALLLGAALYLGGAANEAEQWIGHARKQNDADCGPLPEFLFDLVRLNRLITTDGREIADREVLSRKLTSLLAGVIQREVSDDWQLDSNWLVACAQIQLGQVDRGLLYVNDLPARFASWPAARTVHHALELHRTPEEAAGWGEHFAQQRPFLAGLFKLQAALRNFQFDAVTACLAELRGSAHREHGLSLLSAADCLLMEQRLAQSHPVSPDATIAEFSTASDTLGDADTACQGWQDQLAIRSLISQRRFDDAQQQLADAVWLTVPDIERNRLQAVLEVARDPGLESAMQPLEAVAAEPGALPVDHLHVALCRFRHQPLESLGELEQLHARWPLCAELTLAVSQARLEAASDSDRGDVTTAVGDELAQLCTLTNWTNRSDCAWFRPWQDLLPREAKFTRADIKPLLMADMLFAADLQLHCNRLTESVRTVGHLETLLNGDVVLLHSSISQRFQSAANLAVEKADSGLELACDWHAQAVRRGGGPAGFAERLAARVADAETVSEAVMRILLEWVKRFSGSEQQFLETETGRVIERLTAITLATPEHLEELSLRRRRLEDLQTLKPDWDLPRRGLVFAAARDGNHRRVVKLARSINRRRPEEDELLGHALWHLRCFAEAEAAFQAAGTPGWTGCARAAARLVQMASDRKWLTKRDADEILKLLDTDGLDEQQKTRVLEWRIAVLLGARRGEDALATLEQSGETTWLHPGAMQAQDGLALLLAGRTDEACDRLCPPELRSDSLTAERIGTHREGLGLFLLVRLAWPVPGELPGLHGVLTTLRRLNESSQPFLLAEAQFSLLQNDPAGARRHLARLDSQQKSAGLAGTLDPAVLDEGDQPEDGFRDPAPEELLLAPLAPLLEAERGFVTARIQMQSGEPAAAAAALAGNASDRLWSQPNHYWRGLCLLHDGQSRQVAAARTLLEELAESDPNHAAAPSQLAALAIRNGDIDAAESWSRKAIERDPQHPFALLVSAQIAELRGNTDEASSRYNDVAEMNVLATGRRTLATAQLALGRIAQAAGRLDDAVRHFREAQQLNPENPKCGRRLGLILAVHAQSRADWEAADQFLAAAETLDRNDPRILLGRLCTANALEQTDAVAERLSRLIGLPSFDQLPAEVQHDLALLSADTQLRLQQYGEAANALERLYQQDPNPVIESRLRKCRLLQALQLLGQRPIADGALEKIRSAAEAVCQGDDAPAHAVLLKVIAAILAGTLDKDQKQAALAELTEFASDDPRLQELAWTARRWLGDDSVAEQLAERLAAAERQGLRRCVELITASLTCDTDRFRSEIDTLLSPGDDRTGLPFDANDVMVVGALSGGKTSKVRLQSCDYLTQWHERNAGTEQTRLVHSQLLADCGVKALKDKQFVTGRRYLAQALEALSAH